MTDPMTDPMRIFFFWMCSSAVVTLLATVDLFNWLHMTMMFIIGILIDVEG